MEHKETDAAEIKQPDVNMLVDKYEEVIMMMAIEIKQKSPQRKGAPNFQKKWDHTQEN